MTWVQRLNDVFSKTGWSKKELSRRSGVSYDNIFKYLSGKVEKPRGDTLERLATTLDVSSIWLETGFDTNQFGSWVPLMGYIGAGAEILPDFEQVPPEGLEQIEVPFVMADQMIALQVRGDSMIPRYDDGDVVVVYREQRRAIESFFGEEAAVRTSDGRRFLKQIMRASEGVTLLSWNARPIENVNLAWIGEIYATIRSAQLRRHGRRK